MTLSPHCFPTVSVTQVTSEGSERLTRMRQPQWFPLLLVWGMVSVVPSTAFSSSKPAAGYLWLLRQGRAHRSCDRSERGIRMLSQDSEEQSGRPEHVYESVVKMDDGGSELTKRFKYKVNALMGTFDPQAGIDDENQSGNILSAMLKFPTEYSFHAVGRTNGDEELNEAYLERVKDIVLSLSGCGDDMQVRITPRGKNFIRVTVQVTVDSVAIVNSINHALGEVEQTVMQY